MVVFGFMGISGVEAKLIRNYVNSPATSWAYIDVTVVAKRNGEIIFTKTCRSTGSVEYTPDLKNGDSLEISSGVGSNRISTTVTLKGGTGPGGVFAKGLILIGPLSPMLQASDY